MLYVPQAEWPFCNHFDPNFCHTHNIFTWQIYQQIQCAYTKSTNIKALEIIEAYPQFYCVGMSYDRCLGAVSFVNPSQRV